MVRRKIDNRVRTLIENGTETGHRTMFVVVGDKGRDQVMVLHHMLSKSAVKSRPTVLWCYKKELGFTTHRKKRMKDIQRKIKGGKMNINEDDPFELFIGSTEIRYCYYAETQKILGNTYGMCVLQDFEALTPNLLARTIETVEGGGLVVVLLRSISSLKQLYTMAMDVHKRYRTEAHQDVVGRFNERFLLSLSSCTRCLVVDDELTVLPVSSHILEIERVPKKEADSSERDLKALKETLSDTEPLSSLVNCCKTLDQAKALLKFVDSISEKTLRSTISITAARGRGKSATLGLAVAGAVAFGYANIYVTSPSPENLKTFFEFVFRGFDAIGYKEHLDYGLVQSTNPEYNKALIRVNIFKDNRQTIQYIHPTDANKLSQAELLVIDEAAAIPLPYVKAMLGPYLIFLASTINGYEGTGRSLSLKLLQQLRKQSADATANATSSQLSRRTLHEVNLEESIRYKSGDPVEKWLTDILCLDATNAPSSHLGTPPPTECDLYYINRDTLFSYHKASEAFLHQLVAIFVASHYKNSPNDLQMMSDAPAHHLFCLLGPTKPDQTSLPEILCAVQVCLEGQLSNNSVGDVLRRGKKAAGDLIPWTMANHYQDEQFPSLSGARIVRIATHPDYQNMGYGSRALSILKDYYNLKIPCLEEVPYEIEPPVVDDVDILTEAIEPRDKLPPLLMKLTERPAESLDYIGVSYGLTQPLLKFWKRAGFIPVYVRQTVNEITAEHSCIMLNALTEDSSWLPLFWDDFRRRVSSLFSYQFSTFSTTLGLSLIYATNMEDSCQDLTKAELDIFLTKYDMKRIELYCANLVDYHLILDLMPTLAKLYFHRKMGSTTIPALQRAILLGLGLQHKSFDVLSTEMDLPVSQLLGLYNRMMRKFFAYLMSVTTDAIGKSLGINEVTPIDTVPIPEEMKDELDEADKAMKAEQKKELKKLKKEALSQYAIKGSEDDWSEALARGPGTVVTVKSGVQQSLPSTADTDSGPPSKKKRKKFKK